MVAVVVILIEIADAIIAVPNPESPPCLRNLCTLSLLSDLIIVAHRGLSLSGFRTYVF